MQQFSIRQIEQLSGIKAPTLRIWEKRYNLIEPDRSEGRQRVYTNEDLRAILKVVYLYRKGIKISRIAKLKEQQLLQQLSEQYKSGDTIQTAIPMLMDAAISLDADRIDHIFKNIEAEYGFEAMMVKVIYPFLEQLGRAWVAGRVLPNNEHFISSIIVRKILHAVSRLPKPNTGKRVVLFQPEGEYHEIPLLFMYFLFKKNGWQTVYLGCNVPYEIVSEYCSNQQVSHLYIHLVTCMPGDGPEAVLETLAAKFAAQTIVAGGSAVQNIKAAGENTLLLKNADDILNLMPLSAQSV